MIKLESMFVPVCALTLLLLAGCGADEPTPAKKAATAQQAGASAKKTANAEEAEPATAAPDALPATTARGTLLQRLPKSTLYALRLPHVEKLGEVWERSSFSALTKTPAFLAQRAQMESGLDQALAELSKTVPDLDELKTRVMGLEGELVVAVLGIDWMSISSRSDDVGKCPVTAAVMFDAGAHATEFDALFVRALGLIEQEAGKSGARDVHVEVLANAKESWHRRVLHESVAVDMVRDGAQFMLQVGPAADAGHDAPLATRPLADSFLAADVVRNTPDLARSGSLPVMEAFVNLEPVWTIVDVVGPTEAKRVLASCGLNSIRGISAVAALGKTGIDETFVLHSPGGKDLLTKTLTNRLLNPKLARFAAPDATSAALGAFDVEFLFDEVTKLLPPAQKRDLDSNLAAQRKQGMDWRRDVIANIGPTFGCVGALDWLKLYTGTGLGEDDIDFTLLVELQDAAHFRALLEKLQGMGGEAVKTTTIQGLPVTIVDPIPVPAQNGGPRLSIQPCWHVADDAFVFSFSRTGMEHALSASLKDRNHGPAAFKAALSAHAADAFSVAMIAPREGGTPSTTIGAQTPLGLELTTREGAGSAGAFVFGGGAAIVASVAIPKLLGARLAANESAAIAALRNISSAEAQFQASGVVDLDNDGIGEYGTLGEMSGGIAVRGSKEPLNPPVLSKKWVPDQTGVVQCSGYEFRVHLFESAMRNGDAGERGFTVYAWPIERGQTGVRVFALDQEGDIMVCDNLGDDQRYEGVARMPKPGAHYPATAGKVASGRSRDGGAWRVLE
jgi:hypothetical protein